MIAHRLRTGILMILILVSVSMMPGCQKQTVTDGVTTPPAQARSTTPPNNLTTPPPPTPTPVIPTEVIHSVQPATQTTNTATSIHLMAVGDIMLGRTIGDLIVSDGPEAPFAFTASTLRTADITIGNLECPISERGDPAGKKYTFRAPKAAADSLHQAGFDLVSLANNHVLDYGIPALEDTLGALAEANVLTVGAGMDANQAYAPIMMEVEGIRIAFLAFTDVPTIDFDYQLWEAGSEKPGIAWAHPDRMISAIQAAKKEADLVVVLLHNGYEIVQKVSALQQETAHLAIDSGATLVIGSHPHVLQRIEAYQDGLIVYSMGNFVFDNFLFPPNYSAILSVELSPDGIVDYELIDVIVQLNGVPQIMAYDLSDNGQP